MPSWILGLAIFHVLRRPLKPILLFSAISFCKKKMICSYLYHDSLLGAFFVERLAEMFENMHNSGKDSYGKGKECVNIVTLFAHLYNFKVN